MFVNLIKNIGFITFILLNFIKFVLNHKKTKQINVWNYSIIT